MTTMFTRTITTYKATAYGIGKDENGKRAIVELGHVEYVGASTSQTDARKALKAAGINVPRGTDVEIEKLEEVTYGMTVEEFMSLAHPIERKANEQ